MKTIEKKKHLFLFALPICSHLSWQAIGPHTQEERAKRKRIGSKSTTRLQMNANWSKAPNDYVSLLLAHRLIL
jgi:hypothetical protein